jgi:hypothetical protein
LRENAQQETSMPVDRTDLAQTVRIATPDDPDGFELHLPSLAIAPDPMALIRHEARRWTYVLRSRRRWIKSSRSRERYEKEARVALEAIGVTKLQLTQMAANDRVAVRIPYTQEEVLWETRVFPWEYLLAAATRDERIGRDATGVPSPLTVMRELQVLGAPGPEPASPCAGELRMLFVECLPSELRERWALDTEQQTLRAALPAKTAWRVLSYPTLERLTDTVAEFRPQLIHFAGLDSHQGVRELRTHFGGLARVDLGPGVELPPDDDAGAPPGTRLVDTIISNRKLMVDGVLMQSSAGPPGPQDQDERAGLSFPRLVRAKELAGALRQSGHTAFIVTFNMWNTAARVATLMVGERAALAAVGFQDAFDDALAEFVHATLYAELSDLNWNLPEAFRRMWVAVRELPESTDATGVTLWAAAPVLPPAGTPRWVPAVRGSPKPPPLHVTCQVEPLPELNYAVLHNAQPMFKKFVLNCSRPGKNVQVDVDVAVHMGRETANYRRQVTLEHRRVALTDEIHVPLTAGVVRAEREAIGSTLSIQVTRGKQVLYCNTHRLRLLPVDQWRDNDRDGRWLPSFVQPRDPAVSHALVQAQRYMRVLRDDPTAGFEGYQLAAKADEDSLRGVDQQVEAVWAALLHDWKLGYVNPPPAYSAKLDSQRLRMPSTIRDQQAGTCIDLALLFAACLELIDIYPVIFLLNGHALPGWWRHPEYRDEYFEMPSENFAEVAYASATENAAANAQVVAWHTGAPSWPEIRRWIRERKLVPIETVRLTEHGSFVDAIEAGVEALATRRDFHSMLDIITARMEQVTPLPIRKELP